MDNTLEYINLYEKYFDTSLQSFYIPIGDNVPQRFTHIFEDGRIFSCYLKYNRLLDNWILDIYLIENEIYYPYALNITLQYGLDMLSQYKYKQLGELYLFPNNPNENYSPSYNNLNTGFILLWRHN